MGLVGYSILAIVFALFHHFTVKFEFNKSVYDHRPGHCQVIEGPVHGAEDIEIVRPEGLAFVTSGLAYMQMGGDHIKGQIFLLDLNGKETPNAVPLKIKEGNGFDQKTFHPHGISSYKVNGNIRLFVVSHSTSFEHTIYLFDYDKKTKTLSTHKTIRDKALLRPNDLVATGPESFVFTNDGTAQTEFWNLLEYLTSYRGGSVAYFDGKEFYTLLTKRPGPNGINWDEKKNILFVAHFNGKSVSAYQLSQDRKSAYELSTTELFTGVDNINVHEDGSLLIGCHPVMYRAFHAFSQCENHQIYAPSQVLRMRFDPSYKHAVVSEVYADDGQQISGSASAALFNDHLLIGAVCRQLVHCHIADHHALS